MTWGIFIFMLLIVIEIIAVELLYGEYNKWKQKQNCTTNSKMEDSLFCDERLEYITCLIELNQTIMTSEEEFKDTHEKISLLSEYFEDVLNEKDKQKLKELETYLFKVGQCNSCIAYELGIKKGIEINKLVV